MVAAIVRILGDGRGGEARGVPLARTLDSLDANGGLLLRPSEEARFRVMGKIVSSRSTETCGSSASATPDGP